MLVRASAKVLSFREASFTKPTFLQAPDLVLQSGTVGTVVCSTGRLNFCRSFRKSGPSSAGSTMGLATLFEAEETRPPSARVRFIFVGTWVKSFLFFKAGCRGKPLGFDLGFDLGFGGPDGARVSFSREGRFTGESSRRWRFRGGGIFFGCGDGRICGWSEWLLRVFEQSVRKETETGRILDSKQKIDKTRRMTRDRRIGRKVADVNFALDDSL